jgi:hypothetical protein
MLAPTEPCHFVEFFLSLEFNLSPPCLRKSDYTKIFQAAAGFGGWLFIFRFTLRVNYELSDTTRSVFRRGILSSKYLKKTSNISYFRCCVCIHTAICQDMQPTPIHPPPRLLKFAHCINYECKIVSGLADLNRATTGGLTHMAYSLISRSHSTSPLLTCSHSSFQAILENNKRVCKYAMFWPMQPRGPMLKGLKDSRLSPSNAGS